MTTPANASAAYKAQIRAIIFDTLTLIVGTDSDSDYTTIQDAIDAITDSSASKPYEIKVLPGSYAPFTFSSKNYIAIRGSGRASIINCVCGSTSAQQILISGSHNTLDGFQINLVDGTGARTFRTFAVRVQAAYDNFILENNYFDIKIADSARLATVFAYGAVSAQTVTSGAKGFGEIIRNNVVYTDGSAFVVTTVLSADFHNNTIILTSRDSGTYTSGLDHIGVDVISAARVFWHTGRITSGYGANNVWDDTGNIYAFYVSSTAAGCKLNIQSVQGIIRNDSPTATGDTHYIEIPSTVNAAFECRIFNGFRGQCEADSGNTTDVRAISTTRVPWDDTNNPGRVYWQAGAFVAACHGQISGMAYDITEAADGWTALNRELRMGGNWYCDTSTAAFTINLPVMVAGANSPMNRLTIYNTDIGGANNLTIDSASSFDVEGVGAAQPNFTIAPGTSKSIFAKTDGNYWVV